MTNQNRMMFCPLCGSISVYSSGKPICKYCGFISVITDIDYREFNVETWTSTEWDTMKKEINERLIVPLNHLENDTKYSSYRAAIKKLSLSQQNEQGEDDRTPINNWRNMLHKEIETTKIRIQKLPYSIDEAVKYKIKKNKLETTKQKINKTMFTIGFLSVFLYIIAMFQNADTALYFFYGSGMGIMLEFLGGFIKLNINNKIEIIDAKLSEFAEKELADATAHYEALYHTDPAMITRSAAEAYASFIKEYGRPESPRTYGRQEIWAGKGSLIMTPQQTDVASYFEEDGIWNNRVSEHTKPIDIIMENSTIIPLKNIRYFKKTGDIRYETVLSGGGGGGSSIKGAVVGGLIAGDAGAVIGSRKRVEAIHSTTVEHDTRGTVLKYMKDDVLTSMNLNVEIYDIFEQIIPGKAYDVVVASGKLGEDSEPAEMVESTAKKQEEPAAQPNTTKQKLQELKELYESDLITEDEYQDKKTELLERI